MATADIDTDTMFNYDDASISPSTAAFQVGLFGTTAGTAADLHPYLSRPPSLSPSSQTASLFNQSSLSPPSSASPRSVFSLSSQDEMLLGNSFSSSELDMLLFQTGIDSSAQDNNSRNKDGQPFFLPPLNLFGQMPSQDDTLNLLDLVNDFASGNYSAQQSTSIPAVQTSSLPVTNNVFQASQPVQPKFDLPPMLGTQSGKPAVAKAPTAAATRKQAASSTSSASPPGKPPVGKHNKTERRYRQKVQAAQADLRDSVPALRVLYGTSTPEQLATTDVRADDGTVDGLGEFNRPNASAKTTIFLGARLYIELLQKRVARLQRRVDELENFRLVVAGEDNLQEWKADFDQREAVIAAAESVKLDQDSSDEEEESEEEEPKRKKARVVKPKAVKAPAAKGKGGDLKSFAAFAITFSLLPSAATLFGSEVQQDVGGQVYSNGSATTYQVLSRIPLITAEHTSRLLARALPLALTPSPTALVDWTWRLLLAAVFALIIRTVLGRNTEDAHRRSLGHLPLLAKDVVQVYLPFGNADKSELPALVELASQVVGGVADLSKLSQFHLALRLGRVADDAQSLALLALVQPSFSVLGSPTKIWACARDAAGPETPEALQQVLALSFSEAKRAVALLPRTSSPLTAMSEQITLVHLNDLYSRFFVQLVDGATTGGQRVPDSVKALLANIESRNVRDTLHAALFDQEIRGVVQGVPKGTAAHALGLVLIGLWGLLAGPCPSAQAALATALAAEEVRGVGASLASVGALRELLYPGSKMLSEARLSALPRNATTIDKLALVCIQFIQLLATTASIHAQARNSQSPSPLDSSRQERMERSLNVQKVAMDIRLALPSTTFHGIDHSDNPGAGSGDAAGFTGEGDVEEHEFECAKDRLVGVLSIVGRRAAGRVNGDQDSGVEVDFDDL